MDTKATAQHVGQRIVRDQQIHGGEPTIKGTRVPVRSIVLTYRYYGDVARVRRAYPRVDREAVEQALAFYKANKEEIDRYIAESDSEDD